MEGPEGRTMVRRVLEAGRERCAATRRLAAGFSLGVALLAAVAWNAAPAAESPGGAPSRAAVVLPGSEDCFMCHRDGAGRKPNDEEPPVDGNVLRGSAHAGVRCDGCHADLRDQEMPHEKRLKPVECGSCHKEEKSQHDESLHGVAEARGERLAPTCKGCHGTHNVLRKSDPRADVYTVNIPFLCNRCHREGSQVQSFYHIPQDSILKNYSESIHGEGLFRKGLLNTATCISCHTSHHQLPHTDPRSSIARGSVAKTCEQCHVRIEQVHAKVVRGELWQKSPNQVPVCVDCHEPHKARRVFYTGGLSDRDCMTCHGKRDLAVKRAGKTVSLFVDANTLEHSRHQKIACAQCHTGSTAGHARPCDTAIAKVDCSTCHAEVAAVWQGSTHGQLAAKGSPDAPECRDCHGTHGIRGKNEPDSPTFAKNVPTLCGNCHRTGNKAAVRYKGEQKDIVEHYEESIHGKGLLKSGLVVTATCADCHSPHGELPSKDPNSTVNPANVATTCAKCHRGIYEQFETSIHATAAGHTKEKLPVCSDCHSAHTIGRTDTEGFRLTIMNQCGNCHRDLAESYFETYHGKVSKLGYLKTAKCYDCHGAHDIRRVRDAESHLSRKNIVKTCEGCHKGSNINFAGYLAHGTHHDRDRYPALFYAFWGMTSLLVVTFVAAGIHTLAWLPRSLAYRKQLEQSHALESPTHVRRFPKLYRNLHLMVITSFLALAVTGMTLKFSHTGWAWVLSRLLGGFEAAGFIHRVGAVVTFSYFAIHITDLFRRRAASKQSWAQFILGPDGMMFSLTDLKEVIGSVKWFLGLGPRPAYGRWTYWEKFDYFAVFWGVAVIGMSGLLLWFPTFFTRFVPGWVLNVATIIHSDEALLAVGFIFTVHFFNTHFRPEKFPMDTVIFTGTIPLEEFKQDRPREYEALVKSGELEARTEPAPDPRDVKKWRVIGWVALTIGILLVIGILFAVLGGR